ncbi:DUF2939 domain-containing protein [Acinetobacter equi]|uniref:DUF2939 domain-containing protein n=1 Tax=Acinetobacter equi TaxID=1324350 RepID=A0A0N7GXQ7_9GAMM|nr:DUF2939 domain-containing protein [Acinetobacter equi]ALH95387.1 hypothetical protein AOY20_07465 [Acinetobacter equi]
MKKFITVIILLFSIVLISWIGSAYWSLYQIMQAVENNQPEKLHKYINFPRVQQSLTLQIEEKFVEAMGFDNVSNRYTVLGKKINSLISHQLVENLVTPESICSLMQGNLLHDSYLKELNYLIESHNSINLLNGKKNTNLDKQIVTNTDKKILKISILAWNKFIVYFDLKNKYTTKVTLQPFDWTWKVVDISIPIIKY